MYSKLSTYNKQPARHWNKRDHEIDSIAIHCTSGSRDNTAKQLVDYFFNLERDASCNYVIGGDGSIGSVIEEQNRSWCTSNKACDMRSITIEVASDNKPPYNVTDKAINSLIKLIVDICYRYNITLKWSDDKNERMNHLNGSNMYCHRDFASKNCPGDRLYSLESSIAYKVNKEVETLRLQNKEEVTMPDTVTTDTNKLTKIQGISVIDENNMTKLFEEKYPEWVSLVHTFYLCETAYNIRADLAISQSILETGHFQFKGFCKPEYNNFAGLGVTDKNAENNVAKFRNPSDGIIAQMQHLFAYSVPSNLGTPADLYPEWGIKDPRFKLVKRGSAPYIEVLGQQENKELGFGGYGWATGKDYGNKILKVYNDLVEYVFNNLINKPSEYEDLSSQRDVKDYKVKINPTKIYKYNLDGNKPKVVGVVERSTQKIIEEKDGYGLLEDRSGWINLCFTSYLEDC